MAKSWLIDCRGIAKKVRNATLSSEIQIKDCGAKRECPNCHYLIDNSDVTYEWPGLPLGVKYDPSDVELLGHLAAKCGLGDTPPNKFIHEFIPTLDTDSGICYTHPKDLPGATKNGHSIHFFHKTANAYASGHRKRRKIETQLNEEAVRWHKTGKTKPVFDNGVQKGYKKIMVLYQSSLKGSKPVKSNWVMHQYHLGTEEDEKEGEYVVSRIFYQQQKNNEKNGDSVVIEESNPTAIQHGPKTPTPNPSRVGCSILCDDDSNVDNLLSFITENVEDIEENKAGTCFPPCSQYRENVKQPEYLAGESQDPNQAYIDDPLLCKEIFSSCAPLNDGIPNLIDGSFCGSYPLCDLDNIYLDSPPDFQLAMLDVLRCTMSAVHRGPMCKRSSYLYKRDFTRKWKSMSLNTILLIQVRVTLLHSNDKGPCIADLQFGSQEDSVFNWLDRL